MDNQQPYFEPGHFHDLPLPDGSQAWQKMKRMLDDDDKKRRPFFLFTLNSCALWATALLVSAALAWYFLKPDVSTQGLAQSAHMPSSAPTSTGQTSPNNPASASTNQSAGLSSNSEQPAEKVSSGSPSSRDSEDQFSASTTSASTENQNSTRQTKKAASRENNSLQTRVKNRAGDAKNSGTVKFRTNPLIAKHPYNATAKQVATNKTASSGPSLTKTNANQTGSGTSSPNDASTNSITKTTIENKIESNSPRAGSDSANARPIPKPDSVADATTDSSAVASSKKPGSPSRFIASAGIGLQQQVPLGQQKAVPYDYYGRTGSVYDYIPSVYARLERQKKWFLQAEFRYGAPQSLKEFSFSRQSMLDTGSFSTSVTITTFHLKKTYYHQLPVSFNYYVLPNFSLGAGAIYSRFYGAVTEKEVVNKNFATQTQTVSRQIVNVKQFTDSFLYKTQMHLLLQAGYSWKRFDFGLRFTQDLQPFIRFTRPDGAIDEEKNHTFQFLLRFRLWQSK